MKKANMISAMLLSTLLLTGCGKEEVKTWPLRVGYDFFVNSFDSDDEDTKQTRLLYSGCIDSFEHPVPEYPFLIDGDILNIEYTGEILIRETYPSTIVLSQCEVKKMYYTYNTTFEIPESQIVRNPDGSVSHVVDSIPAQSTVILDKELHYLPLSEYKGEKLYATKGYTIEGDPGIRFDIGQFYAFDPRPAE